MQLELKHNGEQVMTSGLSENEQKHMLTAFQQLLAKAMTAGGQQVVEFFSHGEGKFIRITKEEGKIHDVYKQGTKADTAESGS